MDFDTAFFKHEKCNWADEVERELSHADTEERFSQASYDTWLYYSTTSSVPTEAALHKRRETAGGKQKSRSRSRRSKAESSIDDGKSERMIRRETPVSSATEPKASSSRAQILALVQNRRRDFENCAKTHVWVSNFDERVKARTGTEGGSKEEGVGKTLPKRKNVVSHQVKDGAVLVITRTAKSKAKTPSSSSSSKTPRQKQIKQAKKLKNLPPLSPTPSRGSRADSSSDWKSDKLTINDAASLRSYQITPHKKSKRASRFVIGDKGEPSGGGHGR